MRRRFDMLLTPREKRLLRRFAQGRTDKSIARELCEPVERIAAQRERILEKLQIKSTDELAETAVRLASRGERPDMQRITYARGLFGFDLDQ
jgi:DNA-binding CsgD family transcriptional regulator